MYLYVTLLDVLSLKINNTHSDKNENIGTWREGKSSIDKDTYITYYNLSEAFNSIIENPTYQKDSTILWFVCFKNECDTVKITKPNRDCIAEKVIWGNDTFNHVKCGSALKILKPN